MRRKILIVEDNAMNRLMLHNILDAEYDVLEAENGHDALLELHKKYTFISAVILDIVMPIVDGYEVLAKMRDNPSLAQIPVIVATGINDKDAELKAISLGANDFVTKPYNAALMLNCLRNCIKMRESAAIINAIQRDKLTGLYNRETFFKKATDMVKAKPAGYYVLASFDIDNFKVINDQCGAEEGDRILRYIGELTYYVFMNVGGICGRISGDNFAALYPADKQSVEKVSELQLKKITPQNSHASVVFSIGRYIIKDVTLSASAMYDRAFIAKQSVKGRYDVHVAYFTEPMLEELISGQEIIADMDRALQEKQFELWLQPQFNHATGKLIGAEALARWRHPIKGLLLPDVFVPVFEQNGFVYELDKFIWEQTCVTLRKWLDAGLEPLYVSVNISRYDVFRADVIEVITGLLYKYRLPADYLHLEITESAFAESSEKIIEVVKKLLRLGFIVEIDDFGCGYSSLNTLKDVPASGLKLDMRFLSESGDSKRGGNILSSVVRMANWLNMSVLAEGVETIEQADFLNSIGCVNVQGFLYSKPLSVDKYEQLLRESHKQERRAVLRTVEHLDNNDFWNPASMDTLIFNSYIGAACIFEYHKDNIELLRINDKYLQVLGAENSTVADILKLNFVDYIDVKSHQRVLTALDESIATGEEVTAEFLFKNLPGCAPKTYLRSSLRVIATTGQRYLVYCTNENITEQRQAEMREQQMAACYHAIGLHPEDASKALAAVREAVEKKHNLSVDLRVRHDESGYRLFHVEGGLRPKGDGVYTLAATLTLLDKPKE